MRGYAGQITGKTHAGVQLIQTFMTLGSHRRCRLNMGCGSSSNDSVQPLRPEAVNGGEDESGSKVDGRGDSAVSKGTTDSGVVMENRDVPALPGEVPRNLPPLPCVRESEVDRITQDGLWPKSSEILEELLSQGIIAVGQREGAAGEAYSIMLDDKVSRRPARLESLKASKTPSLPSREEIEEKIRLAEERRKLREDELKTRLRTKSARVRGRAPAPGAEADKDADLTPVEPILHPLTSDPPHRPLHSQIPREEAEGGENMRETAGDGRECREETGRADGRERREEGGESAGKRVSEDSEGEEEELTEVEEFKTDQLLAALEELENDSTFQSVEDKEEMF